MVPVGEAGFGTEPELDAQERRAIPSTPDGLTLTAAEFVVMFGADRGPGLWEQTARIAAVRRGGETEQALAKAAIEGAAAVKAEAMLARDAKALAKANAKTKAAAAAKAEAEAEADDDLAALAEGLANLQADLATIKALGAERAYADTAHALFDVRVRQPLRPHGEAPDLVHPARYQQPNQIL